jgi:N-methylhydantoinase A
LKQAFHAEHARLYGHSDAAAPLQVVSLRLVITAATPKPALRRIEISNAKPEPKLFTNLWLDGEWHRAPVYARATLLAGQSFEGPAVVTQDDATTCVLPGFSGEVDPHGNLVLVNHQRSQGA